MRAKTKANCVVQHTGRNKKMKHLYRREIKRINAQRNTRSIICCLKGNSDRPAHWCLYSRGLLSVIKCGCSIKISSVFRYRNGQGRAHNILTYPKTPHLCEEERETRIKDPTRPKHLEDNGFTHRNQFLRNLFPLLLILAGHY